MPFAVNHLTGMRRHDVDAYIRVLSQFDVDWTHCQRVYDPKTSQWLHVWDERRAAEEIRAALSRETRDDAWQVQSLGEDIAISTGSLLPIVIHMRRSGRFASFELHPHSRTLVERRFPKARPVSNIAIEYLDLEDSRQSRADFWNHVAVVLTGLTLEQLDELGGFRIFDLRAEETVFDGAAVAASAP